MAINYKMTLDQEKKVQLVASLLERPLISILGAICTTISALLAVWGFAFSMDLFKWGFILLIPSVFFVSLWLGRARKRTLLMARLYRYHETKVLTYTLSESDGIIRDFCNETRQVSERKRLDIKSVITTKNTLFVLYHSGGISAYPNTEKIRNFFKG